MDVSPKALFTKRGILSDLEAMADVVSDATANLKSAWDARWTRRLALMFEDQNNLVVKHDWQPYFWTKSWTCNHDRDVDVRLYTDGVSVHSRKHFGEHEYYFLEGADADAHAVTWIVGSALKSENPKEALIDAMKSYKGSKPIDRRSL